MPALFLVSHSCGEPRAQGTGTKVRFSSKLPWQTYPYYRLDRKPIISPYTPVYARKAVDPSSLDLSMHSPPTVSEPIIIINITITIINIIIRSP